MSKLYEIYSGVGGSFGGASYSFTVECETKSEADAIAEGAAFEDYESYEGMHGVSSFYDILEELKEEYPDYDDDLIGSMAADQYQEERENWIEYYSVQLERYLIHTVAKDGLNKVYSVHSSSKAFIEDNVLDFLPESVESYEVILYEPDGMHSFLWDEENCIDFNDWARNNYYDIPGK
jgi:hypothetical protein